MDQKNRFIRNVLLQTLVIFLALNLLFAVLPVEKGLGKLSLYNRVYPGRWRFSWSENPSAAYAVSTNSLDALFASHEVSAQFPEDEYRVFFFGDSSVWGFLLEKEDTLTARINSASLSTPEGRPIRAYNLGYPTISLTKDLLIMEQAMQYQPDLIVWAVTLEAFPDEKQVFTPLTTQNGDLVRPLVERYDLGINLSEENLPAETFFDQTILGQRRPLADLLRLQLYGVMWAATGIDQDIPESYTPLQTDYEVDESYYDFSPPQLDRERLALDVLLAGMEMGGEVPVLIVNEPIYISQGENSDLRYNFYYPIWAYDYYRATLQDLTLPENGHYLDLWDQVSPERFTNTAIHLDAEGSQQMADLVIEKIQEIIGK